MPDKSRPVVVADYGLGNLFSVARALEANGGAPVVTSSPQDIQNAERLVLPGVGAFGDGMAGLKQRGLIEPLRRFAETGRPLIGLCLGMQLLLSKGEEFGSHEGLGLLPGRVAKLEPRDEAQRPLKVPHVGWSALSPARGWAGTVLAGLAGGEQVYFVHSYAPVLDDAGHLLASCDYGTTRIAAVVGRGNLYGCQFHPEKSGPAGMAILSRFLRI